MIYSKTISARLNARRALPRPRWRVRVLRASPAPAGLRARSAGVHVRAGVARPGACACGGTSRAAPPDAEPMGGAHGGRCRARTLGDAHAERSPSCQCMTAPGASGDVAMQRRYGRTCRLPIFHCSQF